MGREFRLLVIQIDLCNRCLLKFSRTDNRIIGNP